jgi:PqqD family protein of HPr-rel-A system
MRYAADPPELRLVEPLDELVAIFHRPSGTTHLLASPAPELLDALTEGTADSEALLVRLARRFDLPGADVAVIEARMAELVEAGLVRLA